MPNNNDLLKEIRQNFDYYMAQWREIREEARTDMKFISGDPWEPRERRVRQAAGRPCLSLDELSQYVNSTVNDVRVSKRAIKIVPKGAGATDDLARFRADIIRQIEYRSSAQAAYATAFQNAVERSYGYFKITARRTAPDSFDQELVIRAIPNPDTVLLDPDAKEADFSDGRAAFIIDTLPVKRFESRWPEAEIKTFTGEIAELAPAWVKDNRIQVAEYWRVEMKARTLLLLDNQDGPLKIFLDELPGAKLKGEAVTLPDGLQFRVLNQAKTETPTVIQYITNGIEILETNPWKGRWIPIVPVMGKEMYVDAGAGSKRIIMSLVRLARDPYMLYCYYRTCQAELVGMTPKVPFVGAAGQFEGYEEAWQNVNKAPLGYLEYKPVVDGAAGALLPPPNRPQYDPPIQSLEMGAESARRAIQAAMGTAALPTSAQRQNQKSGVAIERIQQIQEHGSFHYTDNFDRALAHCGRILNDLLKYYYDTPRDEAIRKPDDSYEVIRINEAYTDKTGKQCCYMTDQGEFDVTITTGPSYQSQREEAAEFADTLARMPEVFARIGDLIVRLRNLGPIGDEIAERLTPPDIAAQKAGQQPIPAELQATLQGLQTQLDAAKQALAQAEFEKKAKILELESREGIAALQETTKLAVAEMKVDLEKAQTMVQGELAAIRQQLELFAKTSALEGTAMQNAAMPTGA